MLLFMECWLRDVSGKKCSSICVWREMFQSACCKFTKLHFNYLCYFIVKSSALAVLRSWLAERLEEDHTYFLAMIIAHNSTALCCRFELDFPTFKSSTCAVSQSVSCNTCNMPTSVSDFQPLLLLSLSLLFSLSVSVWVITMQGTQISFVLNDCVNGCWNSCCLLPIKL